MQFSKDLIEQIKSSYLVPQAWHDLGLPGEPRRSCKVPWRDDRRPSGSLFSDGRRFYDHSAGRSFDVLAFVAEAAGLTFPDAVRFCAERCGLAHDGGHVEIRPQIPRPSLRREREHKPEPWPTLRTGTAEEKHALAELRGFSMDGIGLAEARGLLHFGTYDAPCTWRQHWRGLDFWAVCDEARRLSELRLLSGEYWPERDGSPPRRKAHTVGHGKNYPVGLEIAASYPVIAGVEGALDFVAAHHFIMEQRAAERVGVCGILGAGVNQLAPECLHHFKDKHVRLYPHCDEHGIRAAREWALQIKNAGAATVDALDLSGLVLRNFSTGKDLADLAKANSEWLAANPQSKNIFP